LRKTQQITMKFSTGKTYEKSLSHYPEDNKIKFKFGSSQLHTTTLL
jgi:hypothetical protein